MDETELYNKIATLAKEENDLTQAYHFLSMAQATQDEEKADEIAKKAVELKARQDQLNMDVYALAKQIAADPQNITLLGQAALRTSGLTEIEILSRLYRSAPICGCFGDRVSDPEKRLNNDRAVLDLVRLLRCYKGVKQILDIANMLDRFSRCWLVSSSEVVEEVRTQVEAYILTYPDTAFLRQAVAMLEYHYEPKNKVAVGSERSN